MHQGDPKSMHKNMIGYEWAYIGNYKRSRFNKINFISDCHKKFKIVQKNKRKKSQIVHNIEIRPITSC